MGDERIHFVDSISNNAAIRLNLTTKPWRVLASGTDVAPPPLRRLITQTLLTDGGQIPASAYDLRTVLLHLQLTAGDPATAATQLQLLHQELDRPTNILRWQPRPELPPVYFRTFRAPDYDPAATDYGLNLHDLQLSIPAEPFAIGHRVDLPTATVSGDPAASSNGKFFDVTGVQGDVETPLQIRMTGSDASGRQTLFALRRRGNPAQMPFFIQAESMTRGTDATLAAASTATFSGTGNNTVSVSYATNTALAQRLSTAKFPAAASVDVRGTYRVFLRTLAVAPFPPVATMTAQLRHGVRQTANAAARFTRTDNGAGTQMVDLGLIQLPEGFDPVSNGPEGVPLAVDGIPLNVYLSKESGTSTTLDYLLFVPADDKLCIVNWGASQPAQFVLDGYSRSVYGLTATGQVADILPASYVGDPMVVSPRVVNRITVIRDVAPLAISGDDAILTCDVSCSYWPRYLSVRPVAS